MTDPKVTSLLLRLQHAKALEVNDVLQELLEFPDALGTVVQIVESKIDSGTYFLNDLLASLILTTHSATLYARSREQLLKDNWTAVKLYENRYPDPEIEKSLCSVLYGIASNDGEPLRRHIVDAMRKVGSEAVLPTLEGILFDLEPSAKIRTAFSNSLGPVGGLEARSRAEFVKGVALAIESIKSRTATSTDDSSGTSAAERIDQVDEVNNADRNKLQAQRYIDKDPEVAIIYIRRGTEALAKDLYRRLGCEQKGKPARKMMLEDLLKAVKESNVPEVFKLLVQTFQLFGNFASHDQDEQHRFLTRNVAVALLALYEEALSIYSGWLDKTG